MQAILFDMDGTLVETEDLHRLAFNQTFADFGLDLVWSQEDYRPLLVTPGSRERVEYWRDHIAAPSWQKRLDAETISALHRHKTEKVMALLSSTPLAPRPGVRRLIAEARTANVKTAVVTTSRRMMTDIILARAFACSPTSLFDALICGDDVPRRKPFPDLYLAALAKINVPAHEALAIEDAPIGLASARAAGLPCLITESLYTTGDSFPGAVAVLKSLDDTNVSGGKGVTLSVLDAWRA